MAPRPVISLLMPGGGNPNEIRSTLTSLKPAQNDIQIIVGAEFPEDFSLPHQYRLTGTTLRNFSELVNAALPHIEGDFTAVIAPGIQVVPDLPDIIRKTASQSDSPDYLYGCYQLRDASGGDIFVQVNTSTDDITEREDWGALEFYRSVTLRALGGCDPNLRFRPDYDLRLKLTVEHPACRIAESLCTVLFKPTAEEPGAEALFYPGKGRFGGFSYLFMDTDEEREIEEIFYRALRQRNAYLEHSSGAAFPPPKQTHPRVSVIIPVHNRAAFIPSAVRSVQRGVFADFEIIVVDNASDDDTLAVVRLLAEKDPRLRVISLSDNIIAKALNVGVRESRGEYIAQLDSDDEYTPDTLAAMVSALDNHLDWALAISYYELMDEAGNPLEEFGIIKHREYNRNNILRVDGAGAVRCWRKAAIEEFGGFNEADFGHYGEDYDLVLKVSEKYEVGRVPQVLYRYRRHPGNSDVLRSPEMKIRNKTLARMRALHRRQLINQQVEE